MRELYFSFSHLEKSCMSQPCGFLQTVTALKDWAYHCFYLRVISLWNSVLVTVKDPVLIFMLKKSLNLFSLTNKLFTLFKSCLSWPCGFHQTVTNLKDWASHGVQRKHKIIKTVFIWTWFPSGIVFWLPWKIQF